MSLPAEPATEPGELDLSIFDTAMARLQELHPHGAVTLTINPRGEGGLGHASCYLHRGEVLVAGRGLLPSETIRLALFRAAERWPNEAAVIADRLEAAKRNVVQLEARAAELSSQPE